MSPEWSGSTVSRSAASSHAFARPKYFAGGPVIFVVIAPSLESRRTSSMEKSLPPFGAKNGSEV